jgi:glutathione S-transferase
MPGAAVLVTIPFSHYCEKARWGLERGGVAFREDGHAPVLHILATRRARAQRTVPALVLEDRVIPDSTEILLHADGGRGSLYPEDPAERAETLALEERFDKELGPHSRRVAYYQVLSDRTLSLDLFDADVPAWERRVMRSLFPLARALMKRHMGIDADGAERSRKRVEAVFDDVAKRLADGRRFLMGDRFTAADLTFASLASPVLIPPEYGARLPSTESVGGPFRDIVQHWRATPAGRWALGIYATERRPASH